MNYVVLNGTKSTTIKGLLIQSLPPISKPLMRSQIEEIDGRDGDIVTKLGYSAYDKEMIIGLYGNYDVDQVIQYFDSQGTVIFSNEPDKYYHYQIIEQIDFERLIRFKVAKVVFHCQPFKYSAVEQAVSSVFETADQNIIVINSGNTIAKPTITISGSGIINLSLNGNQVLIIELGTNDFITIDVAQMEAFKDGVLRNRVVSGDYENLAFQIGQNTLSWTGTVTAINIENYSRWI